MKQDKDPNQGIRFFKYESHLDSAAELINEEIKRLARPTDERAITIADANESLRKIESSYLPVDDFFKAIEYYNNQFEVPFSKANEIYTPLNECVDRVIAERNQEVKIFSKKLGLNGESQSTIEHVLRGIPINEAKIILKNIKVNLGQLNETSSLGEMVLYDTYHSK